MIELNDRRYVGLPWKDGGRDRDGVDCAGLAMLWLAEQRGVTVALKTDAETDVETVLQGHGKTAELERGDLEFYREKRSGKVRHVTVYLGGGRRLNIFGGVESRIENGLELLRRIGFTKVGAVSWRDTEALAVALGDREMRAPATWALIAVSVVLSAVSYLLTPSLSGFKNRTGRYGDNALLTQQNPELPLPDLLGKVVVAGNSVYQQLPDKNAAVSDSPPQAWNQIIVLASGPVEEVDYYAGLQIKGITWSDKYFFNGTNINGIAMNPAQTKGEAISGSISSDSYVPSATLYDGAHAIAVPVDVRAQYDRGFPLYGFSGCSYLVLRAFDSSKFGNFNLTCRVKGRRCRTFTAAGFDVVSVIGETGTGDGVWTRFKLAHDDIVDVTRVWNDGSTSFTEMDATHQTGNVFHVNRLKGYIEFLTPPTPGAAITVDYTYHPRAWSQNPVSQMVYLLTEKQRGKGLDESKLDWSSFASARDACDESVTWVNSQGAVAAARFVANYAVDYRKPIQDHLQALLDACRGVIFLSAGKLYCRLREAETSVFSFDETNILVDENGDSTFEAELVDRVSKPNRIKALFHSEETLNAETEVVVEDVSNQADRDPRLGNYGVAEENLKYPAVTALGQAERIATAALAEFVGSNWVYRLKTTIKGLALQVGDVVDVTNEAIPGVVDKLMRIEALEYDEQDRLSLTLSEFVAAANL